MMIQTRMKEENGSSFFPEGVVVLAGTDYPVSEVREPFSQEALDFLEALYRALRAHSADSETTAFAFWCRKAHLRRLKKRHAALGVDTGRPEAALQGLSQGKTQEIVQEKLRKEKQRTHAGDSVRENAGKKETLRLGRGLLFHLAPSNIPMMFAYTWAIGMLAGNAGVVRISSRTLRLENVRVALTVIRTLLDREEFHVIRARTSFITYEHNDTVTGQILQHCDGRVLWGGDATIHQIRQISMPVHAIDLAFPDRVSIAVIREKALEEMSDEEVCNLVHRFYNDTYVMDQNGCSSPQTLIWLKEDSLEGAERGEIKEDFAANMTLDRERPLVPDDPCMKQATVGKTAGIRERWWEMLAQEAEREYEIDGFRAARKLEKAAMAVMRNGTDSADTVISIRCYNGNVLYVLRLAGLPRNLAKYKGGFGLFFETEADSLKQILHSFSVKIQTIVCIGLDPGEFAAIAAKEHAAGAFRFVEAGQAMQMDTVWDGTDLIEALSRRIMY